MILLPTHYNMKPPPSARLITGHPCARGLVFCLLMNENGGDKVSDSSGNGNDALGSNMPTWIQGSYGPALDFTDGLGQELIVSNPKIPAGAFTLVFYGTPKSNQENVVFCFSDAERYPGVLLPFLTSSNKPILYLNSNNYRYFSSTAPVTIFNGNKHHFAFTVTGSAQTDINNSAMYVDGLVQSVDSTKASGAQAARTTIQIGEAFNRSYDGTLEYMYLYNRALSASEIQHLYREPFCMFARRGWPVGFDTGAPPPPSSRALVIGRPPGAYSRKKCIARNFVYI